MAKVYGTNRPDKLAASDDGDVLIGWDKANAPGDEGPRSDGDLLFGGLGDDTLRGGAGADSLTGGDGDDLLFGGAGKDEIAFVFDLGHDTADGGLGIDRLVLDMTDRSRNLTTTFAQGDAEGKVAGLTYTSFEKLWFLGGSGDDYVIAGALNDRLEGADGDDRLVAGDGADRLAGAAGDDSLYGEVGRDHIVAGEGDDALAGGLGHDSLIGGAGRDTLYGQEGRDVFIFHETGDDNFDNIRDFDGSEDRIFLSAALFNDLDKGKLAAGQFALGAEAQDAGDRVIYDSKTGRIWLDADGTGADEAVLVARITKGLILTAGDFLII